MMAGFGHVPTVVCPIYAPLFGDLPTLRNSLQINDSDLS
jgi:hypothetical protein